MRRKHGESLTLELGAPAMAALAGAPNKEKIRYLRLWGGEDLAEDLAALGALDLPGLERIVLISIYLHGGEVRALERLAALPNLRALELDGCAIDAEGVAVLADLPFLGRLRELSITHADLTATAIAPLLKSPRVERLEALGFFDNPLGTAGARRIARARGLASLRALDVSRCGIRLQGLSALVDTPALPRLDSLDLTDNRIGDEGARILAGSPLFPRLRALGLTSCGLGAEGIRALVAGHEPAALERLHLFANALGDEGGAALAEGARFPHLGDIDLRSVGLGDAGAAALAEGPLIESVERLDLDHNRIDGRGAIALAASPRLGRLRSLRIHGNPIGLEGILALRASRWSVVRDAARWITPKIAAPWPTSPARPALDAVWAAVAGFEPRDGAGALRALVARGLAPAGLVGDGRRGFREEQVQTCPYCFGYPVDADGNPCPCCVGGNSVSGWTDGTDPHTVDQAAAFAADAAVIEEVERNARELGARLTRFAGGPDAPPPVRVIWHFHDFPRIPAPPAPHLAPVLESLAAALEDPTVTTGAGAGWPLWAAHCWKEAAARDPRGPFATNEDPFAPYMAILQRGYDAEVDGDAVVLVAPCARRPRAAR